MTSVLLESVNSIHSAFLYKITDGGVVQKVECMLCTHM